METHLRLLPHLKFQSFQWVANARSKHSISLSSYLTMRMWKGAGVAVNILNPRRQKEVGFLEFQGQSGLCNEFKDSWEYTETLSQTNKNIERNIKKKKWSEGLQHQGWGIQEAMTRRPKYAAVPALKAVLMLYKTNVRHLASNTKEARIARCYSEIPRTRTVCPVLASHKSTDIPDFLGTRLLVGFTSAQGNTVNLHLPQMNVCASFNYVYFSPRRHCSSSCEAECL